MAKLALRFISGKYKGQEHPLEEGKEIVLGRSSDADIVLLEDMVSRRHTIMVLEGDRVRITDNGSTNGTFVNGEKITSTVAVKGDRILVGTSIMKLVDASDRTQALESHPTVSSRLRPQVQQPIPRPQHVQNRSTMHSGARSMSGTISEVPLPDLLQLFSTSKKTGTLVLTHAFTIAKIHLDGGRIVYASLSDRPELDPMSALVEILSWEEGDFDLVGPEPKVFPTVLEMPTEHVLMEALRLLDERRKDAPALPPGDTNLGLARPMTAPLHALSPMELDMVQLVWNEDGATVDQLVAVGPSKDEAKKSVEKLLSKGYLKVDDILA